MRQSLQLVFQVCRFFLHFFQERIIDPCEHFYRSGTCHRISTISRSVISRLQDIAALFAKKHSADRKASADPFCKGYDIRRHVKVFICKQFTGTSYSCLHFIYDKDQIMFMAKLLCSLYEIRIQIKHAAFALYHLHHDGTSIIVYKRFQLFDIIGLTILEAFQERSEKLMIFFLSRRSDRCHSPAMERIGQRNDLVHVNATLCRTIFPSRLYCRFIGFCAGVSEKYLLQSRPLCQKICCLDLWFGIKQVGHMLQLLQLCSYCFYPSVITESQTIYADPCRKIDIFLSVYRNALGTLAMVCHHIITRICSYDLFLI